MTSLMIRLATMAFGCRHKHMSWPITLEKRTYEVCCDCGAEFDYSWEMMSCKHQREASQSLLSRGANSTA